MGSVIGKGGQIVKNIREETNSKIRVCEGTLQCEDRVVVIAARDDDIDAEENNAQVENSRNLSADTGARSSLCPVRQVVVPGVCSA